MGLRFDAKMEGGSAGSARLQAPAFVGMPAEPHMKDGKVILRASRITAPLPPAQSQSDLRDNGSCDSSQTSEPEELAGCE